MLSFPSYNPPPPLLLFGRSIPQGINARQRPEDGHQVHAALARSRACVDDAGDYSFRAHRHRSRKGTRVSGDLFGKQARYHPQPLLYLPTFWLVRDIKLVVAVARGRPKEHPAVTLFSVAVFVTTAVKGDDCACNRPSQKHASLLKENDWHSMRYPCPRAPSERSV